MKALLAVLMVALLAAPASAYAEDPPKEAEQLPLVLASFHHATDIPMGKRLFRSPPHPGLLVGTEYPWTSWDNARLFQTANLGFFHHSGLDAALFINSEFGASAGFDFGLNFEALVGLGYAHSFTDRQLYSLDTGEAVTDWGRPAAIASLALGVEYDFRAQDLGPWTLFARYQPTLQVMLGSSGPLSMLPRTAAMFGTRIFFDSWRW